MLNPALLLDQYKKPPAGTTGASTGGGRRYNPAGPLNTAFDWTFQLNPDINNRFDNYESPFNYEQMKNVLEQLHGKSKSFLSKKAATDSNKITSDIGASLASRGITGGSYLDNATTKAKVGVNDNLIDALTQLEQSVLGADLGLMKDENERSFQTTQAATNVDIQNVLNNLRQLGLLGNLGSSLEQLSLQKENQPGLLEDIFSGIGLGAQVMGIPTGKNTNVLSEIIGLFK